MTDYASSRIEKRMLIGWRSGKRDDFQQMRLAAATQPETAHLNDRTYEHREKYSMGHGFYLAVSRYEGWHVRAQSLSALDHYDFEDRVPELARPVEFEGILVRENDPRDGIEILFPWFPKAEVRDALKANGFRWSRAQKLWYARRTEATRQFAQALAERPEAEVRHEEAAG